MNFSKVTLTDDRPHVHGTPRAQLIVDDNPSSDVGELRACEFGVLVVPKRGSPRESAGTELVPWHKVATPIELVPEDKPKGKGQAG